MSWIGGDSLIEERKVAGIFHSLQKQPELLAPLAQQYRDANRSELIALYFLRESGTGHQHVQTLDQYRNMLASDRLHAFMPVRKILNWKTSLPPAEVRALNENPTLRDFRRGEIAPALWTVNPGGVNYEVAARRNACEMIQDRGLMAEIGSLKLGEVFTGASMQMSVQDECDQLRAPPTVRVSPEAGKDATTPAASPKR